MGRRPASTNHTLLLFTTPNLGASVRPRFRRHARGSANGLNFSGSAPSPTHRSPSSSSEDDARSRFSKKGITSRSLGANMWPGSRHGRLGSGGVYFVDSLTQASRPNNPAARFSRVSRNSGVMSMSPFARDQAGGNVAPCFLYWAKSALKYVLKAVATAGDWMISMFSSLSSAFSEKL